MADWPPKRATAFEVQFPIYDADGDLVTGAAGLDSEVSKDHGTFTDCTNEATEIATSSGMYYLSLTATEMTADIVATITKTSTSGAKTAVNVMYTATRQLLDLAYPTTSGRSIDVTATGEVGLDFANTAGTLDSADITSVGAIATGGIVAGSFAAGAIDAAAIAANAIGASELADGAIDRATFAADTGLQSIRSNTAAAGAAGTITLDASASATTDFYVGAWILLTGGTGVGQARVCTAYNGGTKVATIAPNWATNPDNTSTFAVLPAAQITGVQGSLTGSVASVSGAVGSVTGAVGSVTGLTAATVHADLDDIQARLPAALVSGRIDASVGAMAANVMTAAAAAADLTTELQSGLATAASIAALNNLSAAQVNAEVDTALADVRLDELLAADSDIDGAAPPTVGSVFHELLTKTAGSFTYDQATDSLEAVRDNMGTAQTGDAYARLGAPAGASVSADVAAVKTDTAAILVDTGTTLDGRIPAALVGGRMDASVGAMAADVVTASALAASAANEIADAVFSRDMDQVEAAAALHSLCTAVLKAVSRIKDDAGTLKTYRTDGVTVHMSQTITADAANDPIDELTAGV